MHIALIRKNFIASRGGAERYAAALALGLAGRGHRVHVFTAESDHATDTNLVIEQVACFKKPSFLKNLSFQRAVLAARAGRTFDIVNGLSQIYPQDVYRAGDGVHAHWLRVQTPHPVLRRFVQMLPRHRVILAIEREIFRPGNYRMIIVNSTLCRDQVMRYYGVPAGRIRLVYNGVDREHFNPERARSARTAARQHLGISPDMLTLLFAAHNLGRKGFPGALHCAARLKAAGMRIRLLVAGRGRPGHYRHLIERLGMTGEVHFLGEVSRMEKLYGAADLLLHPVRYEPFSNVCLEAMACGCAVLTTVYNGAAEIIEHGRSGFVVDNPDDGQAMAACLLDAGPFLQAELSRIGMAAAQAASAFDMDRSLEETLGVYVRAVQERCL